MSQILKALNKAQKEHMTSQLSNNAVNDNHNSTEPMIDRRNPVRSIDLHAVFLGVLIVLVAIGIYLNYNISLKLASTQTRMVGIADSFKAQQVNFNKLNGLVAQMDVANNGQRKEFIARMDKLSASVDEQIAEAKKFSKSQYAELSKTIEEQQKSIGNLSSQYEQLNQSVNSYKNESERYNEQLNLLKKKLAELNLGQHEQ